ncbi:MAG: ATP-binding cassette domain-containing protein [Nitriliruptorales bacterium]|nr:ATP-binding cassette domain-containing protein [Nitriliruptorales bacterium]
MSGGADVGQLTFDQAVKYYKREDGTPMQVLDGVSFQAKEEQVTALIGPSGCGKSTLLNAVVGLEQLNSGSLSFDDGDADGMERPHIGYVFQSVRLGLLGASIPRQAVSRSLGRALRVSGGTAPLVAAGENRALRGAV